ncbi:hypothetical protein J3E68DRAFT_426010 [Trichoderma sp. SZMC 28012]
MAKVQIAKTDKSTTTVGCTVMAKPQPDGHKIDENHTTLGCTVMAKPKARQHKINKNHTTLGCTIIWMGFKSIPECVMKYSILLFIRNDFNV